ncbi:MAG: DegV family protein [Candidatus Marinimicrobia bacterium]|nr:DegV family protein [Candidatus Neomarinimicrobiota bacterium]
MDKRILIICGDNLGVGYDQISYPYIEYLTYPVIVEQEEYRESETYTASWLFDKFRKEKVTAKSSSLRMNEMIDIVEKNKKDFDLIIHVVMGSNMSAATLKIAEEVRQKYKEEIKIINIDTRQATAGVGVILFRLIDFIKENQEEEDIINYAQDLVKNTFTLYVLPDLNYLYRGGRIGKAKALLGSLLRILPVVSLMGDNPDGEVLPVGQGRTYKQAHSVIVETLRKKMEERNLQEIPLSVVAGDEMNKDNILALKEEIENKLPVKKSMVGKIHLVEAIYLGPGGYGVAVCMK